MFLQLCFDVRRVIFLTPKFGMSAAAAMEKEAKEFVEQIVGITLVPSFHEALKSGVILCEFCLQPALFDEHNHFKLV